MRESDIKIKIHSTGETLHGFTGFTIQRQIDAAADAFAFSLPWEATPENLRRFPPFEKNSVDIRDKGNQILLGYIEQIIPGYSKEGRTIELQGRSATGVSLEWSAGALYTPSGERPEIKSEFRGMKFNAIDDALYIPGGIFATPNIGPFGDEAVADPKQSLYEFLKSLAATAGLWAVPRANGWLEFKKLGTGKPLIDLIEGISPLIAASATHDATQRARWYLLASTQYGSPTTLASAVDVTAEPAIRGTRILPEPQQAANNYEELVKQARSRAIMDGYGVTASVTGFTYNLGGTWRTWQPGDVVRLYSPSAYVLKPTAFMVRQAKLSYSTTDGETTTLDLVFPELFSGNVKKEADYPWRE